MQAVFSLLILTSLCVAAADPSDFTDKNTDGDALPTVPAGFEVTVFARDPLVRQPCSMAFDARGRLFVGMGPQYRNPTPETPGDSVVIVLDSDGDGRADRTQVFATGFNAVQGLAWHGRDLWVANAPDLTVVQVTLGGNTDDGKSGGKGNYIFAVKPSPLEKQKTATTVEQALMLMESGDSSRGEVLFRHAGGAGCFKCHSLAAARNAFGPNLSGVGLRVNHRHLVQSIIEPSVVITEGFTMQTVLTDAGKTYSGVLLEESGLSVSLGMGTGERVDIPKSQIEERLSSRVSAMPSMADILSPQQVADIAAFLAMQKTAVSKSAQNPDARFSVKEQPDRLIISLSGQQVAEFVYADPKILRPYFAQVRTPSGRQVTRNHPPIAGVDPADHESMHPGIWFAFGDVSGHDFWRNKGRIEHLRFTEQPLARDNSLTFAVQSRLVGSDGGELCRMVSRFELRTRPAGWLLVWEATLQSDTAEFSFGDQEEMGFGARVATPITERNGGVITSSTGQRTAAATWGQAATWCDYSGTLGEHPAGVMLIPDRGNFRESWWHNRDYGVFVANPFGRAAMKQGEKSTHTVPLGQPFRIQFAAVIHEGREFDAATEFQAIEDKLEPSQPPQTGAPKEQP